MEKAISLHEFNRRIKLLLNDRSVQDCWIVAELSDTRFSGGHCYMELVEKNDRGATVARLRGIIWASLVHHLRAKFLAATGQDLKSGIKVMVQASVNYHEQYGLSVIINDIDPSYTIGDMERQRQEIIKILEREGIINNNKELSLPLLTQRIAVVSAQGAAGYEDFLKQLHNNPYGLHFSTTLFQAVMQGEKTVPSVMAALQHIDERHKEFDCVVIIRGGGSTTDLNSFDNLDLAVMVTQCQLPVIVGIGHERDVTVLDYVAAVRVKTPTAAAEHLIAHGAAALGRLDELAQAVADLARQYLKSAAMQLAFFESNIPTFALGQLDRERLRLDHLVRFIPSFTTGRVATAHERLRAIYSAMTQAYGHSVAREQMRLQALADKVEILSPISTLRRGYSITRVNGRVVADASQLSPGDTITTTLASGGEISSVINEITL